jgi:replicative DNA helicase
MIPSPSVDLHKGKRRRSVLDARAMDATDRLPPHSLEAEVGVLGCILLMPKECVGKCVERFKPGAAVFYDLKNQTIYEALVEMYEAKQAIDTITLHQWLKDREKLQAVGGLDYIAPLPDKVASSSNLEFYAGIVWDKYILRKVILAGMAMVEGAFTNQGEVDQLVDQCERDVLAIGQERVSTKTTDIKTLVTGVFNTMEKWHANQGALTGISFGLSDLDRMTTGMHGGEMIVIAGRPSLGKTSLAMGIAEAVAVDQHLPVGVFSLEMSSESLVLRMLCSRGRVNLRSVREGYFGERDFPKLSKAGLAFSAAPLHIDDTPGLSILQLRAKARRMWQQFGIKLFVIDYLQLLHSTNRRAENRQQEIADISNGVKALAKELDVPVIVLAQLNRELEKEKNRKPRMSDLRESGAIEQDADLIGMLYRPNEDGEPDSQPKDIVEVDLEIVKQRNGPTGPVHLQFFKTYTRFEMAAKIAPEDVQ